MTGSAAQTDVVVVGLGPVGQALTALLGREGHTVVAVERWPDVFPLPRAGHVDDEVMRIFQALSIAEEIDEDSTKVSGYEFRDRTGEVIAHMDWGHPGISGWYSDYSLYQPQLERLLQAQARRHQSVEMMRGWQVEGIQQDAERVVVTVRRGNAEDGVFARTDELRELSARFVVGCDGANSIVRSICAIGFEDLGFEAEWLVIFAEPLDPRLQRRMPDVAQILDPQRPTTAFRASGKRFCRWEFMLMPGETPESMSSPAAAWHLIADWGFTPENSRLVRHTVFRFQSKVADRWREGRALLAGDAAHLMPPFLGQGMCSGLRDAKTLAWKLDLVLRGVAPDEILDSYEQERAGHARAVVEASLKVGQLICTTDPEAARVRDASLRSGEISPPGALPGIEGGVLARDGAGGAIPPAGRLSMQPTVTRDGRPVRMDELTGDGWVIVAVDFDPRDLLAPPALEVVDRLGMACVHIGHREADADALIDESGAYVAWLQELGVRGLVIRPDFYVFAGFNSGGELALALTDLASQLHLSDLATVRPQLLPAE